MRTLAAEWDGTDAASFLYSCCWALLGEDSKCMSSVSTKMLVRLVTLAITRLRGVELLVACAGAMAC